MKNLIDKLQSKNIVLKQLTPIDIKKEFNSRKKIKLYLGVDLDRYYVCVIEVKKKSKILQKEALELMEFHRKLEQFNDSAIKKKYIYIEAPICSKAKELLKKEKWRVLIKI